MPTQMIRLRRPRRTGIWFSAPATGGRNPALLHEIFERVGQHTTASLTPCQQSVSGQVLLSQVSAPGDQDLQAGVHRSYSNRVLCGRPEALPAIFLRLGGLRIRASLGAIQQILTDNKKGNHWAYPTTQINVGAATAMMAIFFVVIGMLMTTVLISQPWQRC